MPKKSKEFLPNDDSRPGGNVADDDLYNYPSVGSLFATDEPERLNELRRSYEQAKAELDHIIRKGSKEQAESASKAVKAISVTLDFLRSLENRKIS